MSGRNSPWNILITSLRVPRRDHWSSGPENHARGKAWLDQIYRRNYAAITTVYMAAHRDFRWISEQITYGLYLSDHTILDGLDTELVVLAGIMLQNLPRETGWHLRGTRRIGISSEDVNRIWGCVSLVALTSEAMALTGSIIVDRQCCEMVQNLDRSITTGGRHRA